MQITDTKKKQNIDGIKRSVILGTINQTKKINTDNLKFSNEWIGALVDSITTDSKKYVTCMQFYPSMI